MKLQNKSELTDYVMRRLGAPVISINVAPDQVADRLDDALQFFLEEHYDGSVLSYHEITTTADNVSNGYFDIPDEVISIIDLIEPLNGMGDEVFMSESWQLAAQTYNNMRGGASTGFTDYELTQQQISLANHYFKPVRDYTYNKSSNRLVVNGAELVEGNKFIIEIYKTLDLDANGDVFNDTWLKNYATCLVGIQFGDNLGKHSGAILPGGLEINGSDIREKYATEKERLLEEFRTRYQDPVDFMIG